MKTEPSAIPRASARVLPALAVSWAVLILAAPRLGAAGASAGPAWLSAGAYWLGSIVCHQRPGRSFHLAGAQLPVCARCTGLYLSGAIGVLAGWWAARRGRPIEFRSWRVALLAAALPTIVTVAVDWWRPGATSPALRAAAAVPAGIVAGLLLAGFAGFRGRLS